MFPQRIGVATLLLGLTALQTTLAKKTELYDFGDAPASYGTLLADDGPRHNQSSNGPKLGAQVDEESDALIAPVSDDVDGQDDEDGITFLNGLTPGNTTLIEVKVTRKPGYLQAWFDWNSDGDFSDSGEQVISDYWLHQGKEIIPLNVPATAAVSEIQSRFRLSSAAGLGPIGSAEDGEVEDYLEPVVSISGGVSYYPGQSQYATVAFEDRWPIQPDYDMNDVVMGLNITQHSNGAAVTRVVIRGQLQAAGADYSNGFAIQLPGISAENIDIGSSSLNLKGVVIDGAGLESGQSNAVFVITDDVASQFNKQCRHYRTVQGCEDEVQMVFTLDVGFVTPVPSAQMPSVPFDPFIFATPGTRRTGFDHPPGRSLEIHLPDFPPTDKGSTEMMGTFDDDSNPASGRFYRNASSLPWALEFGHEWAYPAEQEDLLQTYPDFEEYVESDGGRKKDWHHRGKAKGHKLFK